MGSATYVFCDIASNDRTEADCGKGHYVVEHDPLALLVNLLYLQCYIYDDFQSTYKV